MQRVHCPRVPARLLLAAWIWILLVAPNITAAAPTFASGIALGNVSTPDLNEASGLAASRQNPGILWAHNDNDWPGNLFALSTNGALAVRYYLPNVFFGDFEDIAIGPGPSVHHQYLYLGDIGDNDLIQFYIRVFRFPEPAAYPYQSGQPTVQALPPAEELLLRIPDGPFDVEGLMIDPITGDLLLATKMDDGSRIYRATQADLATGEPVLLEFVRAIGFRNVSAADVSSDGALVAVRRNNRASLWQRAPSQTVDQALGGAEQEIPLIGQPAEPNGEAFAFHPTGLGYYTVSEGTNPTVYYFRRTDAGRPAQPRVFIQAGEIWRFQDWGADEGTAWREASYDDASWNSGPGQLGYGQGDERTPVFPGEDLDFKTVTTYFRKRFEVGTGPVPEHLALRICFNDGVAVYLNGREILRRQLAPDAAYAEPATGSHSDRQNVWYSMALDPQWLVSGSNVLAVELHRFESFRPDLSFDLQLVEAVMAPPPRFNGHPVLDDGVWNIPLTGPPGADATIEASADLQHWTAAGVVRLIDGTGVFQELSNGSDPRFYRVQR